MARTYKVGSDNVLVAPRWGILDKINARSTIDIIVVDVKSATIANGKTFQIYSGATKDFEGIIVNIEKYERYPGYIEYRLKVADNSAIADKRVIAKVYENQKAGDIVKDFITEKLAAEGVTQGTIQDGITINKAVFRYDSIARALDYIKNVTGYIWNIDKDKKLNFFKRDTNLSPWALTDSVQHSNFSQQSLMDNYRNTQFVRGGKGTTATQTNETPTPKPDGESRNFVVRFPIAEEPTIETNLNGAGWVAISSSDVGVNGLDTGKKWYWSYGSNILTQDTSETVLATVDAVRITYTGLRNLFTKVENPTEISSRASVESNSGIYERLSVEKSISESAQAIEFANGLVEKYGEIKDRIKFRTQVSGLASGQLLTVTKSLYGISAEKFLIESVEITPMDSSDNYEYRVTALDGTSIGGWEEFFKEILKDSKDFSIQENEVLILLNSVTEIGSLTGDLNIQIWNALYPANDLYPSDTLYPNTTLASEVDLSD